MMTRKEAKYNYLINHDQDLSVHDIDFELLATRKTFNHICLRECAKTIIIILVYFIPSIGLTFYQRWFLKDFHFPLTVVLSHLVVKFVLALLVREILGCQKKNKITLTFKNCLRGIVPTGIASGLDIASSNWGLAMVNISLYTMTKSTTIIFILGCAILFKLEKKSWLLVLIVAMISGGLAMFTYKSTQFNLFGFLLLLFASFMSGARWTFAQLTMQKVKNGLKNPIDMIYYVQPWMIMSVLPFAAVFEGHHLFTNYLTFEANEMHLLATIIFKMFVGAIIAFGMEFSEFLVVSKTSSLTLSIAGIFKEIFILVLAVELNGDIISGINYIGLLWCLSGITCHIVHKIQSTNYVNRCNEMKSLQENDGTDLLNGSETKEPLIDENRKESVVSDSEESDSQVLFMILNSRDR